MPSSQYDAIIPVRLHDGSQALIQAVKSDREEDVAFHGYELSEVSASMKSIAAEVLSPFKDLQCDEATVEFSLQLAVKEGQLTSLLVSGSATGSVKVTLRWKANS